jgi:hypothetical protein
MLLVAPRPDSAASVLGAIVGEYSDPASGRHVVLARPADQPGLWTAFVEGARRTYRHYDVEVALNYMAVRSGESTSLFAVVLDSEGTVVGGLRVQGPYTSAFESAAMAEWNGEPGTAELRGEIEERLAEGVIEIKTVWVAPGLANGGQVSDLLGRLFVHALTLFDVRYAICTAGAHATRRWVDNGGVVSDNVAPVAYPDARYRTVALWWDRETVFDVIAGEATLAAHLRENALLTTSFAASPGAASASEVLRATELPTAV